MINCPNCGRENEDEYKYCLGCGTVLPRPEAEAPVADESPDLVACSNCGAQVPSSFKFCGECGSPIGGKPPTRKTAPPSEPEPKPRTLPGTDVVGQLVVIKPDGTEGAKVPLRSGSVRLGRDSEYDVLSSDPFLSPHHATIEVAQDGFVLRDEASLNGVFLRIHGEVELRDGDFIRLGQELLEFREMSDLEPLAGRTDEDKTLASGSPDAGYWGRLALVSGPDVETRAFVFSDDEVVIGREVGDILFRDDGFVSGKHARISRVEGKAFLKDLGSSNGTYVRIRKDRKVENGDLILMGQQLFRLEA